MSIATNSNSPLTPHIEYDLTKIKALVFDVDGVLSANTVSINEADGAPNRTANIKDGYALHLAAQQGIRLCIITGGKSIGVYRRYRVLGVEDIYQGVSHKLPVLKRWMEVRGLRREEVCYMGDDVPDIPSLRFAGLSCCPADAAFEARDASIYISPIAGGMGCVRDVAEQVLKAKGLWMNEADAFGW